jgi:hypothetical protein
MEAYAKQLAAGVQELLCHETDDMEVEMRFNGDLVTYGKIMRLVDSAFTKSKYTEERFISNDNPFIKYRKRPGEKLVSKSSVWKYPLLWSKLHISSEITHEYHSNHLIFSEAVEITRYCKEMDNILIDIKLPKNGLPTVEVELVHENGLYNFVETCFALTSYFTNGTFMDKLTFGISKNFFSELCRMVSVDVSLDMYAKPITLQKSDLMEVLCGDYFVTSKTDGVRCFLWGTSTHVFSTIDGIVKENPSGVLFLFDCERIGKDDYMLLDILFIDHTNISSFPFEKRLEYIRSTTVVSTKKYRKLTSLKDVEDLWKGSEGVVIIENKSYFGSKLFKWKRDNTVDLEVSNGSIFAYNRHPVTQWKYHAGSNGIYEFTLRKNTLVPVKRRNDKKYPNRINVVRNNLLNSVDLFTRVDTRRCYRMRKYHNDVKRKCLELVPGSVLLDIGSGKGGDILKWETTFSSVYCIEKDDSLRSTFEERQEGRRTSIDMLYTSVSNYEDIAAHFDLSTVNTMALFFCINMFDSNDFEGLSKIIHDLPAGTHIPIIFFDSAMIKLVFGSSFTCKDYDLRLFKNKLKISIHGTYVENVTEYYVDEKFIVDYMQSNHCEVFINQLLDEDNRLTPLELRLTMCYRYIMFVKK